MAGMILSISVAAQRPAVAGVRIEPGHGDDRRFVRGLQRVVGQLDDAIDAVLGDLAADFLQRHVIGHKQQANVARDEHHRAPLDAARLGEDFRLAGVMEAGQVHGLFVQRGRGCCMNGAFECELTGAFHVGDGRLAATSVDLAPADRMSPQHRHIQQVETALLEPRLGDALMGRTCRAAPTSDIASSMTFASPITSSRAAARRRGS